MGPSPLDAIPRVRRGSIERRRLLDLVARATDERVVAVTAPAGFGKTTLLAQWAATDPRPVGWVHIEQEDNDPAALLRRIAVVAQTGSAGSRAVAGRGPIERRLAAHILRNLGQRPDGFLLVIDDAHRLLDPAARDAVDWLVRGLPDGCQLALGSRIEPGLPFERWRAEGLLATVEPDDLALDRAECAAMLRAVGVDASDADVDAIRERTAGWAAGVYLVSRLLVGATPDARASVLQGPRMEISDYVGRQILSTLSPDDRRLLVATSVLDRLTGPLCDTVAGTSGGAARLDALARALWFVQPVDPERRWFRCHSVLREALTMELEATRPDEIAQLHRAASAWYREADHMVPAVEHAFLAGDRTEAARLIASSTQRFHALGAMATVRRWYAQLGSADIEANPSVAAMAAWVAELDGDGSAFERWLAAFEATDRTGTPTDGTTSHASAEGMLRALDCRDGPERMLRDSSVATETEPIWSAWWSTATLLKGYGFLMLGDPNGAARCFREISVGASVRAAAWCVAIAELALEAIANRDWRGAEELNESLRKVVMDTGMGDYVTSLLGLVVDARVSIHRGDANRAEATLVAAQMLRRLVSWAAPWLGVRVLAELARAQLLVGDVAGARACVAQIEDILDRRPLLGTLVETAADVRERVRARALLIGATSLTPAELRLLPLLQSYLTFREISDHLGVSHNTVKTQAHSVYSKFGATSRSEAVDFAAGTGLLVPLFSIDRGDPLVRSPA